MTTVTISLPESLKEFVEHQLADNGFGNVSEYFRSLLREAQANRPAAAARPPEVPPQPIAPVEAPAAGSSFRQTPTVDRLNRKVQATLSHPGMSFVDLDIVPKAPATKT